MKTNKPKEDFTVDGEAQSAAKQPVEVHLRAQITQLRARNNELAEVIGSQQEIAREIAEAVQAAEPYPRYRYPAPRRQAHDVAAVLKLSDWHIGEKIEKKEVENFGTFNWDIAREGMLGITTEWLQWVDLRRRVYRVREAHLFAEGDYISGDIHQELAVTNEFPVPVQVERAGHLLAEIGRIAAAHFDTVHIWMVGAGNHDRVTPKPQCKMRHSNSWSYLVHAITRLALVGHRNVVIHESEGAKKLASVLGVKFLLEHGDSVKSHMGIPYYGFQRSAGREAKRRMNTDLGYDYWSFGHFHCPAIIEGNILVNGSLSGTTEYDYIAGRHAKPSQVGFMVHPKHGLFDWTAFYRRDAR